jgi:hypothetical protein
MKNNFKKLLIISFGGEEEFSTYHGGIIGRIIWKVPI